MEYLPIFMDVAGRTGLVVGGGQVAARKVELLRRSGMRVRVVAPELCPGLQREAEAGDVEHRPGRFGEADLDDARVVVAATDDRAVNEAVAAAADARSIPVNVVDTPDLSSFIVPAVIDRTPLVVALSTGGAAPVLARLLRTKLEAFIPAAYGRLAALVRRFREPVKRAFADGDQRRRFWEEVLEGPIADRHLAGDEAGAEASLEAAVTAGEAPGAEGEVILVGAGPGDPDLLTVKALRLMQKADVVVHDRLVSDALMDRVRRDAERVFVGKAEGRHTLPQAEINELLVRLAGEGKRVLRLKGGDPFVFGRGGEEIGALKAAGIPFQVVPGITAALGCSAYTGIPLTHRDHAHAAVFVTGHMCSGSLSLPWDTLVQGHQTVVVYMGLRGLPQLTAGLIERGLPADKPAAVVEQGTTSGQRVIAGTLADLPERVAALRVEPPTLVIVGEVVSLRGDPAEAGEAVGSAERAPAFELSL